VPLTGRPPANPADTRRPPRPPPRPRRLTVRLPRVVHGNHAAHLRHDLRGQIPGGLLHGRTNDSAGEWSLTRQNAANSSVNR
jgi:hypothetical protein